VPVGNWLKGDTLDDPDLLPPPDEVAAEIVENLEGRPRPLPQGRAELATRVNLAR
jgi:hypothetical protein